jgi:hypothetical protein
VIGTETGHQETADGRIELLYLAQTLNPVQTRQTDVHQNRVVIVVPGRLDAIFSGETDVHPMIA